MIRCWFCSGLVRLKTRARGFIAGHPTFFIVFVSVGVLVERILDNGHGERFF